MKTALRWFSLTALYVVAQAFPALVMPVDLTAPGSQPVEPAPWRLLVYLLTTIPLLAYLVHRPRVRGVSQLVLIFIFAWGLQTFMTQIETAYFWSAFPTVSREQMLYLFTRNLITLACFFPLALWMHRRFRFASDAPREGIRGSLRLDRTFAWKVPALGIGYVVLYFVFGYFVAWQFDEVRVFYTGSPLLESFAAQLQRTTTERPEIIAFQFLRGVLWVALSWTLLACLRRSRFEQIIAGAVLVGLLPTTQLVFENPLMSGGVRLAHFVEVTASMMIFGALTAWALTSRRGLTNRIADGASQPNQARQISL